MSPPLSEPPFDLVTGELDGLPKAIPGYVSRPHLLRRLLCSESSLKLTVAPAGFGKSSLHGECARMAPAGTQVVWLELLGHHLSPGDLLMRITEALGMPSEDGEPLITLCRLLSRSRRPLWLMLDDYPRQICPELDTFLENLIERSPAHVQWWICGRRRPAWSLPRLVLQNGLQELDSSALGFDESTLQRLLIERQISLPEVLRQQLLEECQGWPALICLLLRDAATDNLPQLMTTGTPLLLSYLQREVPAEQLPTNAQLQVLQSRHPHWFSTQPLERPVQTQQTLPPLSSLLSKRELAILRLIASGLSNREIAERLCLSVNTVKAHAWNINGKLGTERRTQAVARAKLQGLLS